MNVQANYVVQGFLLALLLPIAGLVFSKFNSDNPTHKDAQAIDHVESPKPVSLPAGLNKGKTLFVQKCASCHHVFKEITGPTLKDFQYRGQWSDRDKLYEWIKNPALFMTNDMYTKQLKAQYTITMTGFPEITKEEVNAIADYIIWASEN